MKRLPTSRALTQRPLCLFEGEVGRRMATKRLTRDEGGSLSTSPSGRTYCVDNGEIARRVPAGNIP
jgi:hypothetical protein